MSKGGGSIGNGIPPHHTHTHTHTQPPPPLAHTQPRAHTCTHKPLAATHLVAGNKGTSDTVTLKRGKVVFFCGSKWEKVDRPKLTIQELAWPFGKDVTRLPSSLLHVGYFVLKDC